MRTDKKKIIPVLLLIVVLGLFTFFWLREGREESSDSIFLSGNIELTTMNLAFTVAGRLIELNAEEGEPVKKGMIIARLEQQQLLHQSEQALATLASSRSRLAELEAFLEYQTENVEAQIEQRRAELMQAGATLDELLSGSRADMKGPEGTGRERKLYMKKKISLLHNMTSSKPPLIPPGLR
jgi:multidrug resistance efflux pump